MTKKFITLMLAPTLILYTGFFIFPAVITLGLSFTRWSGFGADIKWVGWENYIRSFSDATFLLSFKNTLLIIFLGGFFVFLLAFVFSLFLSCGMRGKKLFRAIVFLPFVISVFATVNMWQNLYHPRFGVMKTISKILEIEVPFYFTSLDHVFYAMLIAMVWAYVGFYLVILMAGMDKIPRELYEAAKMDGTTHFQRFTNITLPLIWDVVVIAFTLWVIFAVKNFEFPYAFGSQNIPLELYNTSVYLYIMGFGQRDPIFQMGYASTIGMLSIFLAMVIIIAIRKGLRRDIEEYG